MVSRGFRITQDREIKRVLKLGRRFSSPECSLYMLANTLGHPRMTVVVSAGVSKLAVDRNRLKRQMRDVLRQGIEQKRIAFNFDIIAVLRAPALKIADVGRRAFFQGLLEKARLLK